MSAETVKEQRQGQQIVDSNGPYLVSALRMLAPYANVEHLGIASDSNESLHEHLKTAIDDGYDMIITSGGVSKGRYDLVRHVIEKKLGGHIVFHGVAVRPGAPILMATCDATDSDGTLRNKIAIFGAPGNPLAAATAFRFFITPYLERLSKQTNMLLVKRSSIGFTRVSQRGSEPSGGPPKEEQRSVVIRRKPKNSTAFWLAKRTKKDDKYVEILEDQASYKLSGLLSADCWVIVPDMQFEIREGDVLNSCLL